MFYIVRVTITKTRRITWYQGELAQGIVHPTDTARYLSVLVPFKLFINLSKCTDCFTEIYYKGIHLKKHLVVT